MNYPRVLSEDETVDAAISGLSLARFGDGELRLAIGGDCISQREKSPKLVSELKAMLRAPPTGCLVCIPNVFSATPKSASWLRYAEGKFTSLYGEQTFGSSFITRPDSAPWIDRSDYWLKIERLWADKEITLVLGDEKSEHDAKSGSSNSLTPDMCSSARSVNVVHAPRKNAYAEVDRIEAEIMGMPSGPVLMCLGVTATVLAARLSPKGVHALDLGHIGMFKKRAGAYRYQKNDLASPHYREVLSDMHEARKWGGDGHKHADAIRALSDQFKAATILDYGCGRGELAKALAPQRVSEYDPGIPGKDGMPKPCELVVCTDVLEHVEEEKLSNVLDHLSNLAGKVLYLVIAMRPANAVLPDGRNAHLIVRNAEFWVEKLEALDFPDMVIEGRPDRELRVMLSR